MTGVQRVLFRSAMGPDIFEPALKQLQADEAARGQALEQGRGLAALKAAGAILRPGGFMRGLGAASEAFAGSYEKALQADRAEKRYINQMQFSLADAKRKENMGLFKEARAEVQNAENSRANAVKARQTRDINAARALASYSSSIRPLNVRTGAEIGRAHV